MCLLTMHGAIIHIGAEIQGQDTLQVGRVPCLQHLLNDRPAGRFHTYETRDIQLCSCRHLSVDEFLCSFMCQTFTKQAAGRLMEIRERVGASWPLASCKLFWTDTGDTGCFEQFLEQISAACRQQPRVVCEGHHEKCFPHSS